MTSNAYHGSADSGELNPDIRLADFSGGRVNTPYVVGAAAIPQNKSAKLQNVDTTGKSYRKMRGFSRVSSATVTGDISSIYYDTNTSKVFLSYGTKWAWLDGSTVTDLAGATGLTNNAITIFCRVGDYLVGANGVDAPHTWDTGGSTFATIPTPPASWTTGNYPTFVAEWSGRCFAAGCATNPDILFYSTLYDPTDWTPGTSATDGGAFRIGSDGTPIKAIIPLAVGLLVIKDKGLYLFTGQNSFDNTAVASVFDQTTFDYDQLSPDVNAISARSWVVVADTAYVMGTQQVFKLEATQASSNVKVSIISQDIAYDMSTINRTYADQVCAVHYAARNQIWFGVAGTGSSSNIDTVHVYDYINNGWNLRNGYSHKCMAEVRDVAGNSQIYSGGYSGNSYIFKQNDTVNYDGAAMECIVQGAHIPLGTAASGWVNQVIILMGAQTTGDIQYSYAYDFSDSYYDADTISPDPPASTWNTSGGSTWGDTYGSGTTGTWVEGTPFIETIPIFGRGRRMQHRFYSNLVGSDFDILEILHPVTSVGYR